MENEKLKNVEYGEVIPRGGTLRGLEYKVFAEPLLIMSQFYSVYTFEFDSFFGMYSYTLHTNHFFFEEKEEFSFYRKMYCFLLELNQLNGSNCAQRMRECCDA